MMGLIFHRYTNVNLYHLHISIADPSFFEKKDYFLVNIDETKNWDFSSKIVESALFSYTFQIPDCDWILEKSSICVRCSLDCTARRLGRQCVISAICDVYFICAMLVCKHYRPMLHLCNIHPNGLLFYTKLLCISAMVRKTESFS